LSTAAARAVLIGDRGPIAAPTAAAAATSLSHVEEQDAMVEVMAALAARLKATSLELHGKLQKDNTVLDATAATVEANLGSIGTVREKLSEQMASSLSGLCEAFGLLALGVLLFFLAYATMRLLPIPR
jgi:hypothetical protein